ncbi:plasmid SOS inhibition protein A [Yokenella regensburgei]|uniref:plasmid SOS inhibition protein A n=1 Tax=Yokenella regensburgei TaxID=158877 RepID=UPI00143337A3|nr:plasmid SOS inhibition protein A [Yokenella regensburgei]QIU92608.1 plasmid SOS inhibition protein A [Yokenella regensburgei]
MRISPLIRWPNLLCHYTQEFETCELEPLFWRWQGRFASLDELKWLRMGNEPLWRIIREIGFIVQETPEYTHISERWMVPNKLIFQGAVA